MTNTKKTSMKVIGGALVRPVLAGLFAALIAVCSWIQVPMAVPFTLQTFAVFAALLFLGGKYGTLSVTVYILLGAVGVPVFSGFKSGLGALFGVTGGYITGFLIGALFYWGIQVLLERRNRFSLAVKTLSLAGSLLICYAFGTLWFTAVHEGRISFAGIASSLSLCVLPFLIPDAIKLALAALLYRKLHGRLPAAFR